jgi:NADH/NAD ratio-sensing transcriptional regulator Rex
MIEWELTSEQVHQVIQVLDIATKAAGLDAAKVTVSLMDSLMDAVAKSKVETEQ